MVRRGEGPEPPCPTRDVAVPLSIVICEAPAVSPNRLMSEQIHPCLRIRSEPTGRAHVEVNVGGIDRGMPTAMIIYCDGSKRQLMPPDPCREFRLLRSRPSELSGRRG